MTISPGDRSHLRMSFFTRKRTRARAGRHWFDACARTVLTAVRYSALRQRASQPPLRTERVRQGAETWTRRRSLKRIPFTIPAYRLGAECRPDFRLTRWG